MNEVTEDAGPRTRGPDVWRPEGYIPPEWLMPARAYHDRDWHLAEQQQVFGATWNYACLADDLTEPGAYVCVEAGTQPLVVIRHPDGHLNAFHNVCRHRGMKLLNGTGTLSSHLSCAYHRWSYALDGQLRAVPEPELFCEELDRDELGLLPASVAEVHGIVFVHPSPTAEPVEDFLGREIVDSLSPWDPTEMFEYERTRRSVSANWKLYMENHLDGYHIKYLHSQSLTGYDVDGERNRLLDPHVHSFTPSSTPGVCPSSEETGLPVPESFPQDLYGLSVWALFPNVGVAASGTFWTIFIVRPTGSDSCDVEFRTRIVPIPGIDMATVAGEADPTDSGGQNQIVAEDIDAVEALQAAVRSPAFRVGPMTVKESSITLHQRAVLRLTRKGPETV